MTTMTVGESICLRRSEEDGAWIAEVPALPGCVARGPTEEDARRSALRLASLWLDEVDRRRRRSPSITVTVDPGE